MSGAAYRCIYVPAAIFLFVCLGATAPAAADTMMFTAVRDNTIFQTPSDSSNGQGEMFYAGRAGGSDTIRRGLLQFDVTGLPANVQVDRVTLSLMLADVAAQETADRDVSLHRLLADWGEGASDAGTGSGSGSGAPAETGDATWIYQYFDTQAWSTPGGDFVSTASATTMVGTLADVGAIYTWETLRAGAPSGLVADVEGWAAAPSTNAGWLVRLDDETTSRTVRRFDSSEFATASRRPQLEVEYTLVPEPPAWAMLPVALLLAATFFYARNRRSGSVRCST